jgi:hypothetical protein
MIVFWSTLSLFCGEIPSERPDKIYEDISQRTKSLKKPGKTHLCFLSDKILRRRMVRSQDGQEPYCEAQTSQTACQEGEGFALSRPTFRRDRINVDDHEMSLTLRGSCRVKAVTIGIYMIAIEAPIIHVLKYGLWNQFCRDVPGFIRYSQKQSSIRDGRR